MKKAIILASLLIASNCLFAQGGDECDNIFRGISTTDITWDDLLFGNESPAYNASSFLSDKTNPQKYHLKNAFDNDIKTAWVEGKSTEGIGEKIAFFLSGNTEYIEILPGLGNEKYYLLNNRIHKAFLIVYSIKKKYHNQCVSGIIPGEILFEKELIFEDKMNLQKFKLKLSSEDQCIAVLEIQSVFKGSKWNDTCISEINIK